MSDASCHALDLPALPDEALGADLAKYFGKCREKLGFVPNVLQAYAFNAEKLGAFINFYNDLMLADSPLSKLEREMIAVVVSSKNHCYYCLASHGAAVRELSGDPRLGEQLAMNYRAAELSPKHKAMLAFAEQLTLAPDSLDDDDRANLREAGFSERAIWDIAAVAAFFNMTNRLAAAIELRPNDEYHYQARSAPTAK